MAQLWRYPVKSMQGEPTDEVILGRGGVVGDRAYRFVDVEAGRRMSACSGSRPRSRARHAQRPGGLHVVNTSALATLAAEHPGEHRDARRFRPNNLFDDGNQAGANGEVVAPGTVRVGDAAAVEPSTATHGPRAAS